MNHHTNKIPNHQVPTVISTLIFIYLTRYLIRIIIKNYDEYGIKKAIQIQVVDMSVVRIVNNLVGIILSKIWFNIIF